MLKDRDVWDGEKLVGFFPSVRACGTATAAFQFWTAEMARYHLRLGVFFGALAVILQIPGAAEYRYTGAHDEMEDKLDELDRDQVLDVLADCLKRLGRADLIKQVPGAEDYEPDPVSDEWEKLLDKRTGDRNELLNVVGECLDKLVVKPGMAEIDEPRRLPWWERWRPRQ